MKVKITAHGGFIRSIFNAALASELETTAMPGKNRDFSSKKLVGHAGG